MGKSDKKEKKAKAAASEAGDVTSMSVDVEASTSALPAAADGDASVASKKSKKEKKEKKSSKSKDADADGDASMVVDVDGEEKPAVEGLISPIARECLTTSRTQACAWTHESYAHAPLGIFRRSSGPKEAIKEGVQDNQEGLEIERARQAWC